MKWGFCTAQERESPLGFRFEFDAANKILLGRFEGRLTGESVAESYSATQEHSIATDAHDMRRLVTASPRQVTNATPGIA